MKKHSLLPLIAITTLLLIVSVLAACTSKETENGGTDAPPQNSAENSDSPTILVGQAEATVGENRVAVPIYVQNNPGIASIGLYVTFDEALHLTDIQYNAEIGGQFMPPENFHVPVRLTWLSPLAEVPGDWLFATLYFDITDGAQGEHMIAVSYDEEEIYNLAEENIHFAVVDGCICVAQ